MIRLVWRSRLPTMSAHTPARERRYSLFPIWVPACFPASGQGTIRVGSFLTRPANWTAYVPHSFRCMQEGLHRDWRKLTNPPLGPHILVGPVGALYVLSIRLLHSALPGHSHLGPKRRLRCRSNLAYTRSSRISGRSWISTSRFAMLIPSPSAPCTTDSDSTSALSRLDGRGGSVFARAIPRSCWDRRHRTERRGVYRWAFPLAAPRGRPTCR
jgi:hypothetical protein